MPNLLRETGTLKICVVAKISQALRNFKHFAHFSIVNFVAQYLNISHKFVNFAPKSKFSTKYKKNENNVGDKCARSPDRASCHSDPPPSMLSEKWTTVLVVALCYFSYASIVMNRTSLDAASGALEDDWLAKDQYSKLLAIGTAGYIIGKVVHGLSTDKLGGKRVLIGALLIKCATSVVLTFEKSLGLFSVTWLVSRFAGAAGWPALTNLVRVHVPKHRHGSVWGVLSTSSRVGAVISDAGYGAMLTGGASWQTVFIVAASFAGAAALLDIFLLPSGAYARGAGASLDGQSANDIASDAGDLLETDTDAVRAPGRHSGRSDRDDVDQMDASASASSSAAMTVTIGDGEPTATLEGTHPLEGMPMLQVARVALTSSRVLLLMLSIMGLNCIMEFQSLIPLWLKQTQGVDAGHAATLAAIYPLSCGISVLLGGHFYDRMSPRAHFLLITGSLVTCTAAIFLLLFSTALGLSSLPLTVLLLAVVGLSVCPAYYVPSGVFSNAFGGPRGAFISSLFDISGSISSLIFFAVSSHLLKDDDGDKGSWSGVLLYIAVCGCVGTVAMALFLWREATTWRGVARPRLLLNNPVAAEAPAARI